MKRVITLIVATFLGASLVSANVSARPTIPTLPPIITLDRTLCDFVAWSVSPSEPNQLLYLGQCPPAYRPWLDQPRMRARDWRDAYAR